MPAAVVVDNGHSVEPQRSLTRQAAEWCLRCAKILEARAEAHGSVPADKFDLVE
jgi:hypothetical protein